MIVLSIFDDRIAPCPKWEYYSSDEIAQHKENGFLFAVVDTSYDQFMKAHCVSLDEYNSTIDEYLNESGGGDE